MDNMKVRDTAKIFDSNDKAPYIKKANYELFFYAILGSNASFMLLTQAIKDPENALLKYGLFGLSLVTIWALYFAAKKHMKILGTLLPITQERRL